MSLHTDKYDKIEFAKLIGINSASLNKHEERGIVEENMTMAEALRSYCGHLREHAAGRGGDDQAKLTKARAEESYHKTMMIKMQLAEKAGLLVDASEAERAVNEWATTAYREIVMLVDRIISKLENKHSIEIDRDEVRIITDAATTRIANHGSKIGTDIPSSILEAIATSTEVDDRMDAGEL